MKKDKEIFLDARNCSKSDEAVIEHNAYACPIIPKSRQYGKLKEATFFGLYKDKAVRYVAEIVAVINIPYEGDVLYSWGSGKDKESLMEEAKAKLRFVKLKEEKKQIGDQVFILKNMSKTYFAVGEGKWLIRHGQRFPVSHVPCSNAQELAASLDGKNWGDFI